MGTLNLSLARLAFVETPAANSSFIALNSWCPAFNTDTAVGFQIYPVDPDDPVPVSVDVQYTSLDGISGLDEQRIWKTLKTITSADTNVMLQIPGTRVRARANKPCFVSFNSIDPIVTAIASGAASMNVADLEGMQAFMKAFLQTVDQAAARAVIGAGTSNFSGQYADLQDAPALFPGNYEDLNNLPTLGTMAAENKSLYQTTIGVPELLTANHTITAADDGKTFTTTGWLEVDLPAALLTAAVTEGGVPTLPNGFSVFGEVSFTGAYDADYDFRLPDTGSAAATVIRQYRPDGTLVFRIEGRTI